MDPPFLIIETFIGKNGEKKSDGYYSLQLLLKLPKVIFQFIFETLTALGVCHLTIVGEVANKKNTMLKVFRGYCLGVISYRVLAVNIKSLIINAFDNLETRLTVQFWPLFYDRKHFSSFLVWYKSFA